MVSEKVFRKPSEEGHLKKSNAADGEDSFSNKLSKAANRLLKNKNPQTNKQNKILDPTTQRSFVTFIGAVAVAWGDRENGSEELDTMRTFNSFK